jgi:putative DNA primase/helicase
VALHGTVGAKYLQARGCALSPADGDVRFHPALRHPCGYTGPGLLALVTDAVSRQARTLHRTWINADGTKANVDPPRMLLGGHRKAGGVIRLWPDEAVTTGLAVAEGIETALSLAHSYRPAWACIDAGNLAALPVLPGIECLVIGADHDEAGLRAAEACAERWEAAGVDVVAIAPQTARSDWNDARAAA